MAVGRASTPFLDAKSFLTEAEAPEPEFRSPSVARSPFLSVYELAEGESAVEDPMREAYATLVNELYDEEFDEALFELLTDARSLHQDHLASGHSPSEAERLVTQRFSQLARESEAMVDAVAREFGRREETGIVEGEIETFFEQYAPSVQVDPAFENFFGKLAKKIGKAVKSVAGKAWQGIKKIGLGPILRCTRVFKVRITPHMAEEVESFEGVPLSDYLQDQLGLPEGAEVEAEVHLYEALPGTTVADIARSESETSGLGASDEATVSQLHPLTPEAASALLGKPGLGRRPPLTAYPWNVAAGQRLFHLVIPGRRPLTIPGRWGRRRLRRLFHINITLDAPGDQIRVCIFLSEVKAQKLAVRLRQQVHAGSLTVAFSKFVARRLPRILHGQRPRRLRIVHPGIPPGQSPASVLQRLPALVPPCSLPRCRNGWSRGSRSS
jgi:hypothetical protein